MAGTLTQSPNLLGSVFSESGFERYILYIQKEIVHGKEGGRVGEIFLESGCIEITENLLSQERSSWGLSSKKKQKNKLATRSHQKNKARCNL